MPRRTRLPRPPRNPACDAGQAVCFALWAIRDALRLCDVAGLVEPGVVGPLREAADRVGSAVAVVSPGGPHG